MNQEEMRASIKAERDGMRGPVMGSVAIFLKSQPTVLSARDFCDLRIEDGNVIADGVTIAVAVDVETLTIRLCG